MTAPRLLLAGVALAALLTTACGRREPPPAAPTPPTPGEGAVAAEDGLDPVPVPALATAEPGVRRQLEDSLAAVDELRRDPAADPGALADAYGTLGLRYLTYEFLDAARVSFANARRLAPQDHRWAYLAAHVDLLQGRPDDAVAGFETALELRPGFLPALIRLGRAHLERGEPHRARELFRRALEVDAGAAAAHEGLGRAADMEDDPAAAAAHYARALELQPEASGLHYALGQAYRRAGDLERARHHLERAGDRRVTIADPLLSSLAGESAGAQFHRMRAGEAMEDEDYETATTAWRRALEVDPRDFSSYLGLAVALQKLGDFDGAEAVLRRAVEEGADDDPAAERRQRAEVHFALGGLFAVRNRDAEALPHLERAAALAPETAAFHLRLANALARQGRFADAVAGYDRVLELAAAPDPGVLEARAMAQVNLGRDGAAVADLARAVALAPADRGLRQRYATVLERSGDDDAAARQRAAAAGLGGADGVEEAARLARRQVRSGAFEEALANFRRALEIADEPAVRYEMARVLGHLGRYDEAAAEFRRVSDAAPRHAGARRGEIASLLLAGRYGETRVRLNDALRHLPLDKELALTQVRLLAAAPDPRVRDGRLAVEVARRLMAAEPDLASRDALAMARAEAGDVAAAAELQRAVVAEAEAAAVEARVLSALRRRLEAYEAGRPWHATAPGELLVADIESRG